MTDCAELQRDSKPFASLVRLCCTFGAVVLVQDSITPDLLVVKWLCRDVDEQTARAAIEKWEADNKAVTSDEQ